MPTENADWCPLGRHLSADSAAAALLERAAVALSERATHRMSQERHEDGGSVPVQSLTPLQIERFYADLLRERGGQRRDSRWPRRPCATAHVVLRKALADAERLGLVPAQRCRRWHDFAVTYPTTLHRDAATVAPSSLVVASAELQVGRGVTTHRPRKTRTYID